MFLLRLRIVCLVVVAIGWTFAQSPPTDAECCAQSANYSLPAGMAYTSAGVCSSYAQCFYTSLWDWYGVPFYSDPRYGCCRTYSPSQSSLCGLNGHCMRRDSCPVAWVGSIVTCRVIGLMCCRSAWLEPSNSGTFSTSGLPTTETTTTTEPTTTTSTTEPTTTTTEPTTTTTTEPTSTTTTTEPTTTTTEPTTTTTTTEPTTTTTESTTTTTTTTTEPTSTTTTTEPTTTTTSDEPSSSDDPDPSSTALPPPPSPPSSCSCHRDNALLTHDEAIALFNASGIAVTLESYYPGCTNPVPGCLSLHAVRSSSVLAVIALFEGTGCSLTLVEGVEPGHPTYYGLLSTAHGHVLGVKTSTCVDRIVKQGTAITSPRGFSRACMQTFAHTSSTWCLTTSSNVWIAACKSWVGVDRTREPYECGDNETLTMCATTVNSLRLADGSLAFAEDFGYLQRHGAACPCAAGGVLRAGGPFAVSAATFTSTQDYLSGLQDQRLIEAVTLLLNDVEFTALPYQATSACLISALTVRLDLLRRNVSIADDDDQQLATWQSFGPPCSASDFTKEPPVDTTVCRSRIGLLLDASAAMGSSNFNSGRNALRDFVRSPKLSSNSYVALVTYGTAAVVNFNWTSPSYAGALLPSAGYLGGSSNTHLGISQVVGLFPTVVTPNELPVVIVVTNGRSANSAALSAYVGSMPTRILRFAVGVGSRPSSNELKMIAGSSTRVFRTSSFSRLPRTLTKLMTALCAAPRPVPPPPPSHAGCSNCKTLQQLLRNERRAFTIPVSGNGVAVVTLRPGAGCVTVYASTRTETPGPATYEARATTCAGRGFGSSLSLSTRGWGLEFWKLRVQRWMLTGVLPGPDEFVTTHAFRAQDASSGSTVYAVAVAEETSDESGDASLDFDVEEQPAATMAFENVVTTVQAATTVETTATSPDSTTRTAEPTTSGSPIDVSVPDHRPTAPVSDEPVAASANGMWFIDFDGKATASAATVPMKIARLAVVVTAVWMVW